MPLGRLHILFYCSLLLASGCASNREEIFSKPKPSENLVESFDLGQFKQFQEKSTEPPKKAEEDKKIDATPRNKIKAVKKPNKKKASKEKTVFMKEVPPFINPKPAPTPKIEEKVVKKDGIEIKNLPKGKDGYPLGYPERLKQYDKRSQKIWEQFKSPFRSGEELIMSLSYFGITAGHIKITTMPPVEIAGKKAFYFQARLRSASFYERIYSLDDTLESFIGMDDLRPIKYTLIQRESAQNVDDLQLFDLDNLRTYHWYKRIKRGKKKDVRKNEFIPRYFQDSFSALFFVRGLPLNIGDKFEFPIVTRGKIWILKIRVAKREEIDVEGEDDDIRALKVVAETHFPGVLKKKGDITFWYSDDERRRLLKFEAKVKVGALTGEMLEYKAGVE